MRCLAVLFCLAITPILAADDPSPLQPVPPPVASPLPEAVQPASVDALSPAPASVGTQPSSTQPPRIFRPARNVFELIPAYVKPVEAIVPSTTQPVYPYPTPGTVRVVPFQTAERPVPWPTVFKPQAYDFTPPARHVEECGIQRRHTSNDLQQVGHEATDRVPPAPSTAGIDVRSESEFQAAIHYFELGTKHLSKTGDASHARVAESLADAIAELVEQRAVHHQELADFYGRISSKRFLKDQQRRASRPIANPVRPTRSTPPTPSPYARERYPEPPRPTPAGSPLPPQPYVPQPETFVPPQTSAYRDLYTPQAVPPTSQRTPSYDVVPVGAYDQPPKNLSKPVAKAAKKDAKPAQQILVKCQVVELQTEASTKLFESLNKQWNTDVLSYLGLRDQKSVSQVHVLTPADWEKQLHALRSTKQCKVLSEPTLAVLSGQTASFLSGGEVPMISAVGNNTKSTEFRAFGTQLQVKATVLASGKIELDLTPEISSVSYTTGADPKTQYPAITSRRVQTRVVMDPSQTIVIGGIANAASSTIFAVTTELVAPHRETLAKPTVD